MRFDGPFYACLLVAGITGPTSAQDVRNPLRHYAVEVDGGAHGVYLGKGIVLTANHVTRDEPHVAIGGTQFPAKVIKRGDGNVDLSVLSIDHRMPDLFGLRHISLCQESAKPGDQVLVGLPEGMLQSEMLAPSEIAANLPPKYHESSIRFVARGNSGSGVFEPKTKCLLGIITNKITMTINKEVNGKQIKESRDIANYFVPASEIADFIPAEIQY